MPKHTLKSPRIKFNFEFSLICYQKLITSDVIDNNFS